MLFLDVLIIVLIYIVVLMIVSGFFSLLESNLMATVQSRVGPAYFLGGLLTPIFDGVNLLLNFNTIILQVEILYLFIILFFALFFQYFAVFVLPISNLLFVDINYTYFLLLSLHLMFSVFNIFLVGCFILNSCYIYLGTMSALLISILSELNFILVTWIIHLQSENDNLSINNILNEQILLSNFYVLLFHFHIILLLTLYLNAAIVFFEYTEAESELVAGIITEFAGFFFCVTSLLEIFHFFLVIVLFTLYVLGPCLFFFNFIIVLTIMFIIPNFLSCRINLNTMISFIIAYVIFFDLLYFIYILNTNLLFTIF